MIQKLVLGVYFKISLFLREIMKRKKSHRLGRKICKLWLLFLKNPENETEKQITKFFLKIGQNI